MKEADISCETKGTATIHGGYSIIELLIASTMLLIVLSIVSTLISQSLASGQRESRKTDALTAAHAALNVMSREIANSGFGLFTNGIVLSDSNDRRLHFRSNVENNDDETRQDGEDVTYFHDSSTNSVLRYDPNDTPQVSAVINDVSMVRFQYFDYAGASSAATQVATPTNDTGRVRITVTVMLEDIAGAPRGQTVEFSSDVTLRNSEYMLHQY